MMSSKDYTLLRHNMRLVNIFFLNPLKRREWGSTSLYSAEKCINVNFLCRIFVKSNFLHQHKWRQRFCREYYETAQICSKSRFKRRSQQFDKILKIWYALVCLPWLCDVCPGSILSVMVVCCISWWYIVSTRDMLSLLVVWCLSWWCDVSLVNWCLSWWNVVSACGMMSLLVAWCLSWCYGISPGGMLSLLVACCLSLWYYVLLGALMSLVVVSCPLVVCCLFWWHGVSPRGML